ncbi:MAG TPA: hypothetical protein VD886_25930 [Herpetosiphonaceae bacterium]|nr:hypothetical protein [Herpetosiphonaceae bacterium]
MYSVPTRPRARLLPFVLQCMGIAARRSAFYGFIGGGLAGACFLIIGALVGAPVGLALGAIVGSISGLLCGVILYRWPALFSASLGEAAITARAHALRCFISVVLGLLCLIGVHSIVTPDAPFPPPALGGGLNWVIMLIPALIAGICSHKASGHVLEWYLDHRVFGPQSQQVRLAPERSLADGNAVGPAGSYPGSAGIARPRPLTASGRGPATHEHGMGRVSPAARPRFWPFLIKCTIIFSGRAAAYGLIGGAIYGLLFFIVGALFGAPFGAVLGAVIGAVDGLICGLALYCWPAIVSAEPGGQAISIQENALRWSIGLCSAAACLGYAAHSDNPYIVSLWFLPRNWRIFVIPAVIAGVSAYKATGHLVHMCRRDRVFWRSPAGRDITTSERGDAPQTRHD